jgi:hypothetical protein
MLRVNTLASLSNAFMLVLHLLAPAAVAQGTDTATGLTQSRSSATSEGSKGGTHSSVVHAGAGTSSATTTGNSGKATSSQTSPSPKSQDQIDVPPVPDASLCDSYKGGPAHQGCLQIVLRQKGAAQ